ncbi:MAG: 50S ribosomal protein L30 [Thermoleophilia bacterium]|nr:50S ribosomal protein L30 [Thermoleophilia bacterium]
MMADVRITQIRSLITQSPRHRRTMQTLGLRRIRHSVVHKSSPSLDGQLRLVAHLVKVEDATAGKE